MQKEIFLGGHCSSTRIKIRRSMLVDGVFALQELMRYSTAGFCFWAFRVLSLLLQNLLHKIFKFCFQHK